MKTKRHPALGTLIALLGAASCGGEAVPTGASAAQASAPASAPAGKKLEPGVAQLETNYDLSKLNERPTASVGAGQPADVARRLPQTGLTPVSVSRKGGIGVDGEDLHDLGTIRQGESAQHVFELVSNGEEPLVITGVKPSCGCTRAELSILDEEGNATPYVKNSEIPIGTRFHLLTEVSTDTKPAGPFAAQVSLYSNAPASPTNLRLEAQIEPIVVVDPTPTVYFGRMTTADTAEQTLTVSAKRGETFLLELIQESFAPFEKYLKVDYSPKEPDAEGRSPVWEVHVVLGPDTPMGMRNCPIRFKTDIPVASPRYESPDGAPATHTVQMYVQAQVTGMVHADPAFVSFGLVRPGEVSERSLKIECHDDFQLTADMPLTVEGLQGQPFPYADAISMSVEPIEPGRLFEVKMRLEGLPDEVNGSFGGILKIGVGHPNMPELSVRFSGVCRPGLPGGSGN